MIRYFSDFIHSLNEGLIKTLDSGKVSSDITRSLKRMGLSVMCDFTEERITLKLDDFDRVPLNQVENILDHIMAGVVNRGGWFPASMTLVNLFGRSVTGRFDYHHIIQNHGYIASIELVFEAKFDIESHIPEKLYHLTIKEYEKSILRKGLVPRSGSKLTSHLDRIYLCKTVEDCKRLIPQMLFYYTGEKDDNIYKKGKKLYKKDLTPVIFEIDGKSLNKLYRDPNYHQGFYTMDNVPKEMLRKIDH
jgi:hypothetical protein